MKNFEKFSPGIDIYQWRTILKLVIKLDKKNIFSAFLSLQLFRKELFTD